MPGSRARSVQIEKGAEYEHYSTIHELSSFLGVSDATIKRRIQKGIWPEAAVRSRRQGWRLWSPEQRQSMRRSLVRGVN